MTGVHHRPHPNPGPQQHPSGGWPIPPVAVPVQQQPPMGGYQPAAAAPRRIDSYAIAALIIAVVGLLFSFPLVMGAVALTLGVLALVFGVMALVRSRRGYRGAWMVIAALVVGALVTLGGAYNSVVLARTATSAMAAAQYAPATSYPTYSTPSYAAPVPYSGAAAAPAAPAPTSYTYEVTGNYRATQLSFTDSNGDSTRVNDTSNINTAGSKLPWSKSVTPEPNGKWQSLYASTSSAKGDSWVTCTIKDNTGRVVGTDTGKGAYASCSASTL